VTPRILVVDACCLLNLLATGREVELAAGLDATLVVSPQARNESRFVHGPPDPDDDEQNPTRVPVDLAPLILAERLEVHDMGEEVADAFVECANHLRDADASSVAIAATMRVPLASDDGKVQKVARRLYPKLVVVSTLQIVREAVERAGISGAPLRQILLRDLRMRGNFEPPRRDPERAWFEATLSGSHGDPEE
jgi:hypothetical protein